jgi:hypothetical protein
VYAPRHRSEWLGKISEAGVRRRAEHYYQQLDVLRLLRQEVRRDLLVESKKHKARKVLRRIPGIGPIRAGLLIALMQTPHRFRTKRQLWKYSGLGLETHDSAQYRVEEQLQRSKKPVTLRGLNKDHNHDLKDIFKVRPWEPAPLLGRSTIFTKRHNPFKHEAGNTKTGGLSIFRSPGKWMAISAVSLLCLSDSHDLHISIKKH